MAVTVKPLIQPIVAAAADTTQYTASGVTAIIDKFTATNFGATTQTLSVNLVTLGSTVSTTNLIVKTKTLMPGETYTFPELVGHVLSSGSFISTAASAGAAINIRASGREVS